MLTHFKPVKRFENGVTLLVFSHNRTSNGVLDVLKTICVRIW